MRSLWKCIILMKTKNLLIPFMLCLNRFLNPLTLIWLICYFLICSIFSILAPLLDPFLLEFDQCVFIIRRCVRLQMEWRFSFWMDKFHLEKNYLDIILNCYQVVYTSNISKPTLTHKRWVLLKKNTWKIDKQRHHLNKQIDTSWVKVFSKSSYLIACVQ